MLNNGQLLVIGKNQFVISGNFSHHIGNVLFYKLTPTVIQNKNDLKVLTQDTEKNLWIENKMLSHLLKVKQAHLIEQEGNEKEFSKAG
jgi:uncharacterized protein YaaW (UPF0174 family)